jgi:tetratricopeptide (TPR) repeat protein
MRQLAKAADLDAIAVGSFAKAGDKIRITIRIEDAEDQELLGTRSVEGPEDDLFAMIDELTRLTKQIFNLSQKAIDADLDRDLAVQRTKSVAAASGFAKGLDYSYRGAHLDAARAFEEAIEDDPEFALAYAKAAEAYSKTGYDDKAEQLSLAAVNKAIQFSDKVTPADRAFIIAGHAEITHNSADAIESYNDFIAAYPDDPEGYYKLGMLYFAVSEWDSAAANFTRAIGLDPKFASAKFELAKVLINQDSLDEALKQLEDALTLYRDSGGKEGEGNVLNAIGVLYKRRNQFDKAVSYYEQSLALKEELGDKRGIAATLGNLGSVYEITGRKDRALEVLERSLERILSSPFLSVTKNDAKSHPRVWTNSVRVQE